MTHPKSDEQPKPAVQPKSEVVVPREWLLAFSRETDPTEPIADNGGTVWDMFCHEAHQYAAAPSADSGVREALLNAVISLEELAAAWPQDSLPAGPVCVRMANAINNGNAALAQPAPHSGGAWIEWSGGENPVPDGRVEIRLRNFDPVHSADMTGFANSLDWERRDDDSDIIAYRVVAPKEGGGR